LNGINIFEDGSSGPPWLTLLPLKLPNRARGNLRITDRGDQEASAWAVVQHLLRETDLSQLIDGNSLSVRVEAGGWISWIVRRHPAISDPASTIAKLWNTSDRLSFRGGSNRTGDSMFICFRSKGAPSLHFEIVEDRHRDCRGRLTRGQVDAADPWSHPLKHLLEDYLPSTDRQPSWTRRDTGFVAPRPRVREAVGPSTCGGSFQIGRL
jgi:hypothetical protein